VGPVSPPPVRTERQAESKINRRAVTGLAKSTMKKFIPFLITAVIAIVAVKVVYPIVQPSLAKLPLNGGFFPA